MKPQTTIAVILTLLASLTLVVLGMTLQKQFGRSPAPVDYMKPDTTYIHDTTYIDRPVPKLVYLDRTDTVRIKESHIIIQKDSSLVIPIETKVYKNERYRAVVEGYRPKLKELELYTEHMQITKPVVTPTSRWGIGVTAGPVLTKDGVTAGVMVGITYNLKIFPERGL